MLSLLLLTMHYRPKYYMLNEHAGILPVDATIEFGSFDNVIIDSARMINRLLCTPLAFCN